MPEIVTSPALSGNCRVNCRFDLEAELVCATPGQLVVVVPLGRLTNAAPPFTLMFRPLYVPGKVTVIVDPGAGVSSDTVTVVVPC